MKEKKGSRSLDQIARTFSLFAPPPPNVLTPAATVGDTSFPAISLTWLQKYYLNWTELDIDITEFNNEMPLIQNMSCFDIVQLLWQFVLLKVLYK